MRNKPLLSASVVSWAQTADTTQCRDQYQVKGHLVRHTDNCYTQWMLTYRDTK